MSKRVPAAEGTALPAKRRCVPVTMSRAVASPRPFPSGRVVKNGSKIRSSVASSMPRPGSEIEITTKRPGSIPTWVTLSAVADLACRDLDLDDAWFVHRLDRIVADVEDDLLQLRGFGRNDRRFRGLTHLDFDVGRQ